MQTLNKCVNKGIKTSFVALTILVFTLCTSKAAEFFRDRIALSTVTSSIGVKLNLECVLVRSKFVFKVSRYKSLETAEPILFVRFSATEE